MNATGRDSDAPGPSDPHAVSEVNGPFCSPLSGCITCSDEGRPMRVLRVAGDSVAECEDEAGARHDVLIGVVDGVTPGDLLLVHAGAALLRLADVAEGDG